MIDDATVRELALALPEAEELDHWGHPSFRVKGKIFATLWPAEQRAVLKFALPDQAAFSAEYPDTFTPVPGGWGRHGSTYVALATVTRELFQETVTLAWHRVAPQRLIAAYAQAHSGKVSLAEEAEPGAAPRVARPAGVTFDEVRQIALTFPEVVEGSSYGTPGFRVRNAFLGRLREDGATLVLKVGELEREPLLALEPDIYYLTDHYVPSPCVLVRLPQIRPDELRRVFALAWRRVAPKRLTAAYAGHLPGDAVDGAES